ncbi:MAG TPA: peptide chain release factor N(5)-glutamine methyltransferase [Phycisphaerae bacterium]|nr:peptide chain release factor N(5)-glutamine methyltransferase [Phycisphaerae bacterium]
MPENHAPIQEEWTVGRLLTWTKGHLETKGIDEPRLAAELLLAHALGCKRIELYTRYNQVATAEQRAAFREMVIAAAEHKPIAYLIGHREFYSLDFIVTPDVLIPRPETELLVELALAWCQEHPADRFTLLDIGTGSGCIAITIAKRQPGIAAMATDISPAALAVAARNGERHGVADRVRFLEADLLSLPPDTVPPGGFDIIVSNPPYIAERDREALPQNVRDYEPGQALLAGEDGLDIYRRLSPEAAPFLRPGGTLILEVGFDQADAVENLFAASSPPLQLLGRSKDLNGIDRAIQFTLPA